MSQKTRNPSNPPVKTNRGGYKSYTKKILKAKNKRIHRAPTIPRGR